MILDKAKMAHDWAIARLASGAGFMTSEIVEDSWKYADLMQAEADKREKEEAAQKRKEIREMLNAPNTFVEREGQHFDDVCSDEMQAQRDAELYGTGFLKVTYDSNGVKYKRLDPETISMCSSNIGLDSQVLKEWQPDWSQAPEWANYIAVYSDCCNASYFEKEPKIISGYTWGGTDGKSVLTPIPVYTGNWQDSLRKRPQ